MEANGKLQRSNNKCLWPECLVEAAARDFKHFKGFKAGKRQAWTPQQQRDMEANGRLQRSNNRGLWRQTAGCNARTTEGYGGKRQAATLEQQRAMEANGRLQRSNNKCMWQRSNNRGLWRQTARCNARTRNACGQSAWWKLPRGIVSILRVLSVLGGYGGKRQADRSCREALRHLKPRKTNSTPAVVPGAAPAFAKAGVGG